MLFQLIQAEFPVRQNERKIFNNWNDAEPSLQVTKLSSVTVMVSKILESEQI